MSTTRHPIDYGEIGYLAEMAEDARQLPITRRLRLIVALALTVGVDAENNTDHAIGAAVYSTVSMYLADREKFRAMTADIIAGILKQNTPEES